MSALEPLKRVAPGDYETEDRKYRIVRLLGVSPPAWDVVEDPFLNTEETVFGGCATLADARLFLRDLRGASERCSGS